MTGLALRAIEVHATRAKLQTAIGPMIPHYAFALDVGRVYQFVVGNVDADDGLVTLAPSGGTVGRWKLVSQALTNTGQWGELWVAGGSTPQTIDSTFTKIVGFTNAEASSGITASAATDDLTVAAAGSYDCKATVSFSGTVNETFTFSLFVDGAEYQSGRRSFVRKLSAGGDVGDAGFAGRLTVTAGQVVDLRALALGGDGKSVTIASAALSLHEI